MTELLAGIGFSKATRGRMLARGQVVRGVLSGRALRGEKTDGEASPAALVGGEAACISEKLARLGDAADAHAVGLGAPAPLAAGTRLSAGDVVVIAPLVTREAGPVGDGPVSVLYEDEFVLAVDKPAGILVHGDGSGAETLTARVQGYLRRAGSPAVPQALQRLDVETSGVVLFSKVEEFQPLFDALVAGEAGEVPADPGRVPAGSVKKPLRKVYLAIVDGVVPWESRTCDAPIGRDRHDARRMRVSPTGQSALTQVRRLAASPDGRHTLLQVELGTGRRHQIRVHLAHLGFPVTGDPLYGSAADGGRHGWLPTSGSGRRIGSSALVSARCDRPSTPGGCRRPGPSEPALIAPTSPGLMLHATLEQFVHPITGAPTRIESPYPARFATLFPEAPDLL